MMLFQDLPQDPELSQEKTLSVIDLIFNGGTGSIVIISVLFLMLGVALYIYFERILAIKAASKIDGKPLDDINTAIENAGTLEVYKLEKNVSVLATVAGAAPMIGFLGTVIGMILAFHEMATSGGQAEMGSLASGIYTAMTTTVAGLIVGIIAYIGYNHLVNRTDKVVHKMEANAVEFLDLLNEPL